MAEIAEATVVDRSEERLLRLFIGKNPEPFISYLAAERDKSTPGFMDRFNLVALFAPVAWFFYRRMYLYGAFIYLLPIVVGLLFPKFSTTANMGGAAALAIMANHIYFYFARGRVTKIERRVDLPAEARDSLIRRSGGTSVLGAILGTALTVTAIFLMIVNGMRS